MFLAFFFLLILSFLFLIPSFLLLNLYLFVCLFVNYYFWFFSFAPCIPSKFKLTHSSFFVYLFVLFCFLLSNESNSLLISTASGRRRSPILFHLLKLTIFYLKDRIISFHIAVKHVWWRHNFLLSFCCCKQDQIWRRWTIFPADVVLLFRQSEPNLTIVGLAAHWLVID